MSLLPNVVQPWYSNVVRTKGPRGSLSLFSGNWTDNNFRFFWIPQFRVRFTVSTFCMIWKDTIFTVISILNFFKSSSSQTFIKTKIILESNTIVFDPYNLFVFVNVWLLVLFKKFNMDIWVKMVSFQIMQNALNVKTTQVVEYNS